MKKKLLNCLLPLACLATVSVSCGSSAQAAVLGDDYPSSWKYGGFGVDPWTMYWRQCTSFAAYRLSNTNGFYLQAMGMPLHGEALHVPMVTVST